MPNYRPIAVRRLVAAAVVLITTTASSTLLEANGFANAMFIQPTDLVAGQGFGFAVSTDGNVLAAGTQQAPFVVYVYVNNNGTWLQQARLTSPTGNATDRFGASLAVQGGTLVVGAPGASAAYVYTSVNGLWMQEAMLTPTGGSGVSFAGSPLNGAAISGNTIVIGAPSEPTAAGSTGAAYVFSNVNGVWAQQARIVSSDPLVAGLGLSVALQGDNLLIGAPFTSWPTIFQPGAAFVYTRANGVWTQQARLDPADVVAAGLFGQNVSLDGTTAAVGEPRPNEVDVFVSANGVWTLQSIINGPDDSDFGTSVKVIGDLMLVTAYDDLAPTDVASGDAFIYTRGGSTWTLQQDLIMAPALDGIPGPAQLNQRFGNFAAMAKAGSETIFVIGSQLYSNPDAARVGAVYTATLK